MMWKGDSAQPTLREAIARASNNSNGKSSNSPEHFVIPKAWTDRLLAEIKTDEDTIPHDLLLWEAR